MLVSGINVSRADGIIRLRLARPDRLNALTPELISSALAELDRIEAEPEARVLIVTGEGKAFCAGFDITRIESMEPRDLVEDLCGHIAALPLPVIARVNGVASGAGCDLAVSCDLRVAAPSAQFSMPPAKLGITYSWQGTRRLVRLIGPAAAKEMLFTAELIGAERAVALGLVDHIADDLDAAVDLIAAAVAANAPLALAASKRIVDLVAAHRPGKHELAEIEALDRRVWASEDAKEGARAFKERRSPRFRGR